MEAMQRTTRKHSHRGNVTKFGILPSTISLSIREPGPAISHFAAFLMLLMGFGPLVMRASLFGSPITLFSMVIFLLSSSLLYAASTTYHTVVLGRKETDIFRKIDHGMISVMIAGSYTPVCLTVLKDSHGYALLAAIWALAVAGILIKLFWISCPHIFSSALYLLMGWLCVFTIVPLWHLLPREAFFWLVSGGILYTAGAVIYSLKLRRFNEVHLYFDSHTIFHLFIMAGTLCHYIMMFRFISLL
ncbi:hemolysin III [Lachnospiraceae bacterium]|nr:hemolysin III [Lachnospiraceae bacterium]